MSQQDLQQKEQTAVDKAKAAADASFRPSASALNAASAEALLASVDGPALDTYQAKESVYVGRSVPIAAGSQLEVPIQVTAPGSIVEYSIELKAYDVGLAITAEREDGVTIVKEEARLESAMTPLQQKFLVGSVPCTILFRLDNSYSWMREKIVSYRITVTPPSHEALIAGRRRRAQACLKAVQDDLQQANTRLQATTLQKNALQQEVARLMNELNEKKKAWQVTEKEELWLMERQKLRLEQEKLLQERLNKGWNDEPSKK